MEAKLGDFAKDVITGFSGIVTSRTQRLHGCDRLTVSPRDLKDGKPVDPMTFDVDGLEVLEPGVLVQAHQIPQTVSLGDLVCDRLTKLEGAVFGISTHLFANEVTLVLQPIELKDGRPMDFAYFDQSRVLILKSGQFAPKRAPVANPTTADRRGGPRPETRRASH